MAKFRKIWLVIIFAVAVYLVMSLYADFGKLAAALKNFHVAFLFIVFALTTFSYFLRFFKWDFFLKRVGVHLKLKDSLFVFFSGLSMIVTPGKIGEIWKGWLIKDINGEPLSKTVPVVIMERLTDLTGLILLSVFGVLYYYQQGVYLVLVFVLILIGFCIAVRSRRISGRIISFLGKRAGKYTENIKTIREAFEVTMELKGLIGMTLLSAVAWFCECLGIYMVVLGFQETINIALAAFIFSFASLAGAISMIPGGLGVAEATISGMLQMFGFVPAVSIGIAIIVRFGTLWYGAAMGIVVYLLFRKKNNNSRKTRG